MIEAIGVGKRYAATWVLSDLNLRIEQGEMVLLLGANGAGKTTLLRAILGITGFVGSILVDGRDPLRAGKAVRRRIGYMPQSGGLHHDLTVAATLRFYAALRRTRADVAGWLRSFGLEPWAARRVGELSIGLRQRLGFAVATLGDPPILLLDEPTASLDEASQGLLVDRLRRCAVDGKTIVISTHSERRLAALADRALRLEAGRLVA